MNGQIQVRSWSTDHLRHTLPNASEALQQVRVKLELLIAEYDGDDERSIGAREALNKVHPAISEVQSGIDKALPNVDTIRRNATP